MTRAPDPAFERWIAEARALPLERALAVCPDASAFLGGRSERAGECPRCGGRGKASDRFSIDLRKQRWGCRRCPAAGKDALSLVIHYGAEFLDAVELLNGPPPRRLAAMAPEERAKREVERAARRAESERLAAIRAEQDAKDRARAIDAANAVWDASGVWRGTLTETYLRFRGIVPGNLVDVRHHPTLAFSVEDKEAKSGFRRIWTGPAMVVALRDATGALLGVQRTWIDPRIGTEAGYHVSEKGRPDLRWDGKALKTKKTLGVAEGCSVALIDGPAPRRMFAGEGNETVLSVHTELTRAGSPLLGRATFRSACSLAQLAKMHVPDSVSDLWLLGDGDSDAGNEPGWTRAQLEKAAGAQARPGLTIRIAMAPDGADFNDLSRGAA